MNPNLYNRYNNLIQKYLQQGIYEDVPEETLSNSSNITLSFDRLK